MRVFWLTRLTKGLQLRDSAGLRPDLPTHRARYLDQHPTSPSVVCQGLLGGAYPPAIAPTIWKGSAPSSTASGSGVSGDSWDRSSPQAKNLKNARRCCVT